MFLYQRLMYPVAVWTYTLHTTKYCTYVLTWANNLRRMQEIRCTLGGMAYTQLTIRTAFCSEITSLCSETINPQSPAEKGLTWLAQAICIPDTLELFTHLRLAGAMLPRSAVGSGEGTWWDPYVSYGCSFVSMINMGSICKCDKYGGPFVRYD